MQEFGDFAGDIFSACDSFDDSFAAIGEVASDEDFSVRSHTLVIVLCFLSDGEDDGVGVERDFGIPLHGGEFDGGDVVLTVELDGFEGGNDGDAEVDDVIEFSLGGGHGFEGFDEGDIDGLGAALFGGGGAVHGDVATADDDDASEVLDFTARDARAFEEGQGGFDALEVGALEVGDHLGCGEPHADVDGVVLRDEFVEFVFVDASAEFKLDAEGLDGLDVLIDDFVGKSRRGDAVAEHAAGLFVFVIDGDADAEFCEFGRHGKSGGTRADAGDLFAATRGGLEDFEAKETFLFHGKRLEFPDLDGLVDAATRTGFFAESFLRTNLGTGRPKDVVVANGFARSREVSESDGPDKPSGVGAGRAVVRARRVFAKQTPRSLFHHKANVQPFLSRFSIGELSYFCHDPSPKSRR